MPVANTHWDFRCAWSSSVSADCASVRSASISAPEIDVCKSLSRSPRPLTALSNLRTCSGILFSSHGHQGGGFGRYMSMEISARAGKYSGAALSAGIARLSKNRRTGKGSFCCCPAQEGIPASASGSICGSPAVAGSGGGGGGGGGAGAFARGDGDDELFVHPPKVIVNKMPTEMLTMTVRTMSVRSIMMNRKKEEGFMIASQSCRGSCGAAPGEHRRIMRLHNSEVHVNTLRACKGRCANT